MSDDAAAGDAGKNFIVVSELTADNRWRERLEQLQQFYYIQFAEQPKFFVRVPGRVNIIGEHVDYCGFPVLPMAIDQCILLAVGYSKDNTFLHLRNLEEEKFQHFKCDLNSLKIEIPHSSAPEWYNYYLCGIKGIYETLTCPDYPIGMTVALSGNIPPASGLSSSSALVSAATLATAYVHQLKLERSRLASISATCERYIGTEGGGMDQAIAFLGKEGCAQFIEFHPELRASPIVLPRDVCFVVANSLAEKNKAASADFNERVVECRLSSCMLAKKMKFPDWYKMTRLARVQHKLGLSLAELDALVAKELPKEVYTRSEICKEFNIKENELIADFLTKNTSHMKTFKLRQRTQHVIKESLRVAKFRSLCEQAKIKTDGEQSIEVNGQPKINNLHCNNEIESCFGNNSEVPFTALLSELMQQSHQSLRHDFECSHQNLDKLVEISEDFGIGARLTGAGWGGCIVAICDSFETSYKYIQHLKEKYFALLPRNQREKHQENDFQNVVFATFPRNGAEIFKASTTGL